MNIEALKSCLTVNGREELGIPYVNESISHHIFSIASWALEGPPEAGRQVWFGVQNGDELRGALPAHVRCRILPLNPTQTSVHAQHYAPSDAFLLPKHGFQYGDPNLTLEKFWKSRGKYEIQENWKDEGWNLWYWKPSAGEIRVFGMDHHHAVLWDVKQILRPLGIRLDFYWLSDGRAPVNEAIPNAFHPFYSSLDIYKSDPKLDLEKNCIEKIQEKGYKAILTSHSLITAFRLRQTGLPIFHVNSTRFGNEWVIDVEKHSFLVQQLETMFRQGQLHVLHNNRGDQMYFRQFFRDLQPSQELYVPSFCYSPHRLRTQSVEPKRFLIWDTRQVLLHAEKSPFMKKLYFSLRNIFQEAIDSQALLLAESKSYLPEGYLDKYTAVIHLPYNVSTMSIFQQTSANIPVWVPSAKLLEELWIEKDEPNEISWTVFTEGSERNTSPLDNVREKSVIQKWIAQADFYREGTLSCILTFDSIEDLAAKILTTDYNTLIQESQEKQRKRRLEIVSSWEQMLKSLRK
jgi:hypothetical protein